MWNFPHPSLPLLPCFPLYLPTACEFQLTIYKIYILYTTHESISSMGIHDDKDHILSRLTYCKSNYIPRIGSHIFQPMRLFNIVMVSGNVLSPEQPPRLRASSPER